MKYYLIIFFLFVANGVCEDLSSGKYATVYAERMLSNWDKNGDHQAEKSEIGRLWNRMKNFDVDKNEILTKEEIENSTIRYLDSRGERKLNVLYKKTAEEDLYLDIYYPETNPRTVLPVVFYTHGGGWAAGSKQSVFPGVYLKLLDEGFCVVAINYRRYVAGGSIAIRDCVIDCKDAVRYIAKNSGKYHIDPMRCFVHGDSAGGQIAQMLLLSTPESLPGESALADTEYKMLAGVSWYGPCDFENTSLFNHDDRPGFRDRFGPRIIKPGTAPEQKLTLYREMSPIQYLHKNSPPLLMIQGDSDTTIPVKHAYYMKEKAEKIGAPVEVLIVTGAGHNWRQAEPGTKIEPSKVVIEKRTVEFLTFHAQ